MENVTKRNRFKLWQFFNFQVINASTVEKRTEPNPAFYGTLSLNATKKLPFRALTVHMLPNKKLLYWDTWKGNTRKCLHSLSTCTIILITPVPILRVAKHKIYMVFWLKHVLWLYLKTEFVFISYAWFYTIFYW